MNVEAYGAPTTLPWRMCSESIAKELYSQGILTSVEEYQSVLGGALGVHPTFFYESLWNFVGLLLVYHMGKRRKFDGQCFLFYIFWYGLGRAWIEGLRTDSLYLYVGSNIRVSQLLAAASALAAGAVLVYRLICVKKEPETLYVDRLAKAQEEQSKAEDDTQQP